VSVRRPSLNASAGGIVVGVSKNWGQQKDGSLEMIMGVEEVNETLPGCWAGPHSFGPGNLNDDCGSLHFWSLHEGGSHFLFVDGSKQFLKYRAVDVMPALASRAGGESVPVLD
jgi:prepilin-type processing-associated H-X9-DG protein